MELPVIVGTDEGQGIVEPREGQRFTGRSASRHGESDPGLSSCRVSSDCLVVRGGSEVREATGGRVVTDGHRMRSCQAR